MTNYINVPVREIGPLKINGDITLEDIYVPLATFETPLWPSVKRGALISQLTDGITVTMLKNNMTRSVILEGKNAQKLKNIEKDLNKKKRELSKIAKSTSDHIIFKDFHSEIIGNLLYVRFAYQTGEASGHNMTTKATDAILQWICNYYELKYVSISANICADKKVSAINAILGRGKSVIAEIVVPEEICKKYLNTTPKNILELIIKKNYIGSILAGSIRSANAHYANILLATYLAFGQDAANIVEGSQGITYANINSDGSLYFSVNCQNIIVGTVGNGKELDFVKKFLNKIGCDNPSKSSENSEKLAGIIAATILCSELSLLAAQTNQGELIRSHEIYERN